MKSIRSKTSSAITMLVVFGALSARHATLFAQGSLNPPGAPAPTMKTLSQVEPRIPVDTSNTPGNGTTEFILSSAGSYYLTANVDVTKTTGIAITAEGVTLDLNGFEIRRTDGSEGTGIRLDTGRSALGNGIVRGFQTGISAPGGATRLRLAHLTITSMTSNGIVTSSQALIENCIVENVGGIGITAGVVSQVRKCSVRTTGSHGIKAAETSIIEDNILNNCLGDSIIADNRCNIRNNVCDFPTASGAGIHLTSNQGESRVENNNIMRRAVGIKIDGPDNYVSGNTVRANADNYDFASRNFLNLLLCEIPESIDWPASVKLAGSLTGAAGTNGITINSSDVTIDLGGHALVGVPGSADGVNVSGTSTNLSVCNGTVRNWGGDGVNAASASNGQYQNLHLSANGGRGLMSGPGSRITGCTALANGSHGIGTIDGSTVSDCTVQRNSGNGINALFGNTVTGCTAQYNDGDGIQVGYGNTVSDCTASANKGDGIEVFADCAVLQNTCDLNGWLSADGAGIHATSSENRIDGNSVTRNDRGLDVDVSGNLIIRNSASGNAVNYSIVANNKVGPIVAAPNSAAINGSTGGAGVGSTDPWANFSY